MAQANQALTDAVSAALAQEKAFVERRKICYAQIVAESCLIDATEDNALAERHIRAIEIEARQFKRRDADREAQLQRAKRRTEEAANAPQQQAERDQAVKSHQEHLESNARAVREFESGAAERARRAAREQRRLDEKNAARLRKLADERAGRTERAERARTHENKVNATLERAREKEARALERAAATAAEGARPGPQITPQGSASDLLRLPATPGKS